MASIDSPISLRSLRNNSSAAQSSSNVSEYVNDSTIVLGPQFEGQPENTGSTIPQADGGKDAWLFLAGCFIVEALVWGFPFAFGIFQSYYSEHEPFRGQRNIAVIGTTAMGIIYIGSPAVFAVLLKSPQWRRPFCTIGLVIMCLALAASSFSNTTTQLILSQGVGYAIGGSFLYCPTILFVDEWFIQKKGLAYGVMWAGTGLAGFILPLAMDLALDRFGFRTVLRAWSIILFVLTGPLLFYIKPRLPGTQSRSISLKFVINPTFLLLQLGNVLQGFGFFLPSIYLPTIAAQLGGSRLLATLTLVLFNVASVFGCVAMGRLIDTFEVTTCIFVSTIGSALSVFLFWGLADGLPLLYVFCITYGLFAGGYSCTYTGVMKATVSRVTQAEPGMVFSLLAAGRGIGNVASGPLSETLIKNYPWKGSAGFGYGSGYGPLIVFTGMSMFLGSISVLGRAGRRLL